MMEREKIERISNELDKIGNAYLHQIEYAKINYTLQKYQGFSEFLNDLGYFNRYLDMKLNLDECLRELLINESLITIFKANGYDPKRPKMSPYEQMISWKYHNSTTEQYEKNYLFELSFRNKSNWRPVIIKYSESSLNLINRYLYSKIYIIDWNEKEHWHNEARKKKQYKGAEIITIKDLFEKFLPSEMYSVFINKTREYVYKANCILGFDVIQTLTPNYLYKLKKDIQKELLSWNLYDHIIHFEQDNGNKQKTRDADGISLLAKVADGPDLDIIKEFCFEKERYRALFGLSGFAKCFITAEYLYSLFKRREYALEFTSVACGYIKCIEQLVYQCILIFCDSGKYFTKIRKIPHKNLSRDQRNLLKSIREQKGIDEGYVPFIKDFENAFVNTLSSMQDFLQEEEQSNFWNISPDGQRFICELISNYAKNDRNLNFHKDNITDFAKIEAIRNHTITIALLLLGALDFPKETEKDLAIYDDTFDKLVEVLGRTDVMQKYILEIDDELICARRTYNVSATEMDENGNLSQYKFLFLRINEKDLELDFGNINDTQNALETKDIIRVTSSHYPKRIWIETNDKKRELIWLADRRDQ